MSQLSLLDPPPRVEAKPAARPTRQQAVRAALATAPDGLETSEAGAILHELRARQPHGREQRCKWCGVDGRAFLRELARAGLVAENRGRQLWYPILESKVEVHGFPPDFDGPRGEYNSFPVGY